MPDPNRPLSAAVAANPGQPERDLGTTPADVMNALREANGLLLHRLTECEEALELVEADNARMTEALAAVPGRPEGQPEGLSEEERGSVEIARHGTLVGSGARSEFASWQTVADLIAIIDRLSRLAAAPDREEGE